MESDIFGEESSWLSQSLKVARHAEIHREYRHGSKQVICGIVKTFSVWWRNFKSNPGPRYVPSSRYMSYACTVHAPFAELDARYDTVQTAPYSKLICIHTE